MRYLLDTNVVINYLEASLPKDGMQLLDSIVDDEPMISIITKIETLGFDFKAIHEQNIMELFISGCTIIEINNEIAEKTIVIRKRNKIKTPDAIIAATAIVHHLTLITSDNGFNNIAGLMVLNPNAL